MRKLKIVNTKLNSFITDWNFKSWILKKLTNGKYACDEINLEFESPDVFVKALYGKDSITDEEGVVKFVNYELETEDTRLK